MYKEKEKLKQNKTKQKNKQQQQQHWEGNKLTFWSPLFLLPSHTGFSSYMAFATYVLWLCAAIRTCVLEGAIMTWQMII